MKKLTLIFITLCFLQSHAQETLSFKDYLAHQASDYASGRPPS